MVSDGGALRFGGRYRLSRELGRGSTGAVWEGVDEATGEPVAVKILHTPLRSRTARARFDREVSSAAALFHPHSVRVKAHGETAGGAGYLVMERLNGRTLSGLLADGAPLPEPRAIRIVAQILDAMSAAHRMNIVHRDLKPSNVILTEEGPDCDFVKVCDFGLAKVVDGDAGDEDDPAPDGHATAATGRGIVCGTAEYIAPEQARGEPLDARADLYSIAVILFQAVVGELPFQGRSPLAIISQHLGSPPPRPRALRPELAISVAMENLILRGLAKDRRERPSSAEVFRADLLQIERDLLRERKRRSAVAAGDHERDTLPSGGALIVAPRAPRWALLAGGGVVLAAVAAGLLASAAGRAGDPGAARPAASTEGVVAPRQPAADTGQPGIGTARAPALAVDPHAAAEAGRDRGTPRVRRWPPPDSQADGARRKVAAAARPGTAVATAPIAGAPSVPSAVASDGETVKTMAPAPEPEPVEAQVVRAEDLLAEGEVARACALGEVAVARSPRLAAARGFLGRCYMREGQTDRARASYRAYLELAPDAPDAPFVRTIVEPKAR